MDKEGGADTLFGPADGGTGRTSSNEDAGPDTLQGAVEKGQEGGQRDQGRPSLQGYFGHGVRRL